MEIISKTGIKYKWDKEQQAVIYTKNMMFGHYLFFVKKEKDGIYHSYKVFRFLDHTIVKYSKKLNHIYDSYDLVKAWRMLLTDYLGINYDDSEKIIDDIAEDVKEEENVIKGDI